MLQAATELLRKVHALDGYAHPAEPLLLALLEHDRSVAYPWLLCRVRDRNTRCAALYCLSRLPAKYTGTWLRPAVAVCLRDPRADVREYITQLAAIIGTRDLASVLQQTAAQEQVVYLAQFMRYVAADLYAEA